MTTFALSNPRKFTAAAAALASLAHCRQTPERPWWFVLAIVPRPSPQVSSPPIGCLNPTMLDWMEEDAERWDGLS